MINRKPIKTEDIVFMYTVQHLTMEEIAKITKMSRPAIHHRLKKAGITSNQGEWVDVGCSTCYKSFKIQRSRWKASRNHYCSPECRTRSKQNPDYDHIRQIMKDLEYQPRIVKHPCI